MEILKVDNLTKIYGKDTNKVVALDHVSFSVEKVNNTETGELTWYREWTQEAGVYRGELR